MLLVHAVAGFNTAGVGDFWRDIYWAAAIARGEAYPLAGPPIYGLVELGPWWFYLLAMPLGLTGSVATTAAFIQVLAGLKYMLAWRLGARFAGEGFGFALAASLCVAGWSTMTLMFPSHTAVIETTPLLLAFATWQCWYSISVARALLFGLACGACLNAHSTTATYVVLAGGALAIRHVSWRACALVALAALVAALTLVPPLLAPDVPAASRSLRGYVGANIGVAVGLRLPALVASMLVGGAWNGFPLMTTWSLAAARAAWLVYAGCPAVCVSGLAVRRFLRGIATRRCRVYESLSARAAAEDRGNCRRRTAGATPVRRRGIHALRLRGLRGERPGLPALRARGSKRRSRPCRHRGRASRRRSE